MGFLMPMPSIHGSYPTIVFLEQKLERIYNSATLPVMINPCKWVIIHINFNFKNKKTKNQWESSFKL